MISPAVVPIKPPFLYNFEAWNVFYLRALRFHECTYPERRLVSDRIATFRRFMSAAVVEHLSCFVAPHPRYHTREGWPEWVACVRTALGRVDASVDFAVTPEEAAALYEDAPRVAGTLTDEVELWRRLDFLVFEGHIDGDELRQRFWDTVGARARAQLVEQCPYFDPQHEVWAPAASRAARSAAALKLARVIELVDVDAQAALQIKLVCVQRACAALAMAACAAALLLAIVLQAAAFVVPALALGYVAARTLGACRQHARARDDLVWRQRRLHKIELPLS